jgi:hypothetical protein
MIKYNVLIKGIVIGILILLFGTSIGISNPVSSTTTNTTTRLTQENTNEATLGSYFGLLSGLDLELLNFIDEPLEIDAPYLFDFNVSFSVTKGYFGQMILWYCLLTQQDVNVTVTIEDVPSWCTAYFTQPQLRFAVDGSSSTQQTSLFVSVNEHAPAFELFYMTINVSVDTLKGPFGFLPFVQGSYTTAGIGFSATYRPLLDVTVEDPFVETTPGTTVVVPITVSNLGNGETLVSTIIDDPPEGWMFTIDPSQLIIGVNDSKVTNLSITPPADFYGERVISLWFTPRSSTHPEYEGTPISEQILVKVKAKQ